MKKNSEITYREIYGQPDSFAAINETLDYIFQTLDTVFSQPWDELLFTGCGTSFYLAQSAAFAFSECTGIPAKAVPCSELYYFPEVFVGHGRNVLVLPITRKSYTTEVRMAIDKVRTFAGVKTLAITCDANSQEYNDYMILSPRTQEESVIMTRSFTSMVYLAQILALYAAGKKDEIDKMAAEYVDLSQKLLQVAECISAKIIKEHHDLNLFITLGQGINYGIANECMNKIKEMSIANSEAYYTLEYRHGPMSLVDQHTLLILLANDATTEMDRKLMAQMKQFGGVSLAIGTDAAIRFPECDYILDVESSLSSLQLAAVIGFIGQFLGYAIAQFKNIDADTPRHLAQAIVLEK